MNKKLRLPLTAIVISFIALIILGLGGFKPVDNALYDSFMAMKTNIKPVQNIVIIEIDSKSIKNIGRWPWKRSIHAQLLKKVIQGKPAVIGLNILFSEQSPEDKALIDVLQSFDNIILAFSKEKKSIIFPAPEFKQVAEIADVHMPKDSDGVTRQAYKVSSYLPDYDSFSTAVAQAYNPDSIKLLPLEDTYSINYMVPTSSFNHVSYSEVLKEDFNVALFRNKIVLIGVTADGLTNYFSTPLTTRLESSISGTELQAHAIYTIITGKLIHNLSLLSIMVLLFVIAVEFEILLKSLKPLQQIFYLLLYMVAVYIISFVAFKYLLTWVFPVLFLFIGVLIYLVLSYKTLFRVNKAVDKTLEEIQPDDYLPLANISSEIERGVYTLSELSQFISQDRQMIKAILDAIKAPVLVMDKDFVITWKNKQALLKPYLYSIKTLTEFGIDKESLLKDLQVNNYHQQELQLSDRDFAVIFTPYGEGYSTIVCVFNDVTELKQLDRMKTDLLRTVSHEIKTPLTIIQSYCDLGLEMQDGKVALEYLEKISQNTEYLTELVTDYLDLNKLEANLVQLKLEPININDLLQGVLYEMQTLADQKCIELLLNTEQDANYVVLADKARIKQVFVNLISNAVKYSETNKTVNIFVKKLSEMIKISIKDEGYGIELDEIAMIFDKFYRIRSDQTENITGTGLGLAIVKKIIELHQGDIKVSSKPGEGTQFDIYLQRPQTEENIDEHIFD